MKFFSYFQGLQQERVNLIGRISLLFRHGNLELSKFAASKSKYFYSGDELK